MAGLVAGAALGAGCGGDEPARRPSLVLIVVDTLRGDLGRAFGPVETPALDALAADGVAFRRAFGHAPMTLPSHTSLFSSRPPFETAVRVNGQDVDEGLPLLAEWLGEHGYRTHGVLGLATLDSPSGPGIRRGFEAIDADFWRMSPAGDVLERLEERLDALGDDPFFLFAHFSDPHEPYNAHGPTTSEVDVLLDGEPLERVPTSDMTILERELELAPGVHTVELRSEEPFLVRWIEGSAGDGTPLRGRWDLGIRLWPLRYVRYQLEQPGPDPDTCRLRLWVHDPVDTDEVRRRYRREVEHVDRHVGALLEELRERGLYDDAVIVFTSDHGEALGERGHVGHVQGLYDEQLHVPLIVKPARGDARGRLLAERADVVVPHLDVVPTALELLGLPPLPGQRGLSLLGEGTGHVLAETHRPQAREDSYCLRDERFKLILYPDPPRFEMYDLEADPGETVDVFESLGGLRPRWIARLVGLARLSREGPLAMEELEEATRQSLQALGYGG